MHVWARTILTAYRYLERLSDAIDTMIENRGINSMNLSGASYSCNNIFNLAEKIIELSQRKVKLINLKILTEDVLEKCGEKHGKLLILKYIDKMKNVDIAKVCDLSLRTYFRRLESAEQRFEEVLSLLGYDEKRLEEYLSGERWILEIKNRIEILKTNQDFIVESRYLDKLAVS